MAKNRRPRRPYNRKWPRNCERAWSIAERIAYYSRPDPLSGCHIWQGYLKGGYGCLGGKCFNVFIGDTRSSQSLTATLFDFALGRIGECTSTTETTPNITSGRYATRNGVPPSLSASVNDATAR